LAEKNKVRLLAHLTLLEIPKNLQMIPTLEPPDITISEFQIPSEGLLGFVLKKIQDSSSTWYFHKPTSSGFSINGEW
jgi:hypothetical protein